MPVEVKHDPPLRFGRPDTGTVGWKVSCETCGGELPADWQHSPEGTRVSRASVKEIYRMAHIHDVIHLENKQKGKVVLTIYTSPT